MPPSVPATHSISHSSPLPLLSLFDPHLTDQTPRAHDAFDLAARFLIPSAVFGRQLRMAAQIVVGVCATSLLCTFQRSSVALGNKGLWSVVTVRYSIRNRQSRAGLLARLHPAQPGPA